MRKLHIIVCLGGLFSLSLLTAQADEGMWLLPLLKQQNIEQMKGLGLEICAEDIYNPDSVSLKDAVVIFGNGCTGEVISPQGLVLTNHHCGYNYIQAHSSVDNDLLTNGFWARNRSEELPNPGLTVTFIDKIEEVTDYVEEELEKDTSNIEMKYLNTKFLNSLAEKRVGEEFLKDNPGTSVIIKPFYGGNRFYMFTQKIYSDVRLVGAPPSSIGKFGADTDNWSWPRHAGDFSLFRIYADSLGNPAPYDTCNIPLQPKKYFSLTTHGVEENDFVMLLGFPGSTHHFYTPIEVEEQKNIDNRIRIAVRDLRQRILLDAMLADPEVRIQYAGKYATSTNSYKSSKGMNIMIDRQFTLYLKERQMNDLLNWGWDNDIQTYRESVDIIANEIKSRAQLKTRLQYLTEALWIGTEFSHVPTSFEELKAGINSTNPTVRKTALEKFDSLYYGFYDKDYAPEVDCRVSKAMLKMYADSIAPEYYPTFFKTIRKNYKNNIDKYVNHLFKNSLFVNPSKYEKWKQHPNIKKVEKDEMVQYARSVKAEIQRLRKALIPSENEIANATKEYIAGLLALHAEKPNYPDANFTLRLSYGQIKSFSPANAIIYNFETTLDGVMEKEDSSNWEFVVDKKLKELYQQKDFGRYSDKEGKMPVDFIANTHTTGGNSGSPVLNGRGELVGINFDRNWEGIAGDIQYQDRYQRSIITDIRYVLFIIDKYANADYLLDEMTINP
ncbi:MAG: S46 family peptidase [Porphyromonadaceae bacterium]|nr:S46 family peptidase [Porphyromonadaceae bacterium]